MQQRSADLAVLSAIAAQEEIARGSLKAVELSEACLQVIAERDPGIAAWAYLDPGQVLKQADTLDSHRASGRPLGMLHGLPVGVKDIIDTADMPTENGTPIDAGRRPRQDAAIVRRLRQAGAVVMGKTVSTELGSMHPRGTRNPHDAARSPGGSSSGSAAAVAAGMVPLAIGTQTNGSVIRPASFCGVVGFKPSFGLIPRSGILPQAPSLDTVGVFARTLDDVALLADALIGHDPADPDSLSGPPPRLLDTARSEPPVTPSLAFVKTPSWDFADPETRDGFDELVAALGQSCEELALPAVFGEAAGTIHKLGRVGIARHYRPYLERGADQLSEFMRGAIGEGRAVPAVDYLTALDWQKSLAAGLEPLFDRFDAIVTPAAPGEAPPIATTGNPAFNGLWTLCGVPAVTLPLMQGPNGLPVGVQLVGRRGDDARLLRTARWLAMALQS
jgi:Asp-tRNA(Asn)/Glu-tRNA(Gln) amidotransferase A subunit family amidase